MNNLTVVRSEEAIKGLGKMWNQGNSCRMMAGKSWYILLVLVFWLLLLQEEEIKREVVTMEKHMGRILNLPRQSQRRQIGRKNFPNKSLNVGSQKFFKLLMEMFFYLVDG